MKNLFYIIGCLGFGYVIYLNWQYWGGSYGFATLFGLQLITSLPFIGFWIYFLFKRKSLLNIALSVISFMFFAGSWVISILNLKSFWRIHPYYFSQLCIYDGSVITNEKSILYYRRLGVWLCLIHGYQILGRYLWLSYLICIPTAS